MCLDHVSFLFVDKFHHFLIRTFEKSDRKRGPAYMRIFKKKHDVLIHSFILEVNICDLSMALFWIDKGKLW